MAASTVSAEKSQSFFPPGHLFAQHKTEPVPPSSSGDTWKFFSLSGTSTAPPQVSQDYHTVNLSDLNDFSFGTFPQTAPEQVDSSSRRDGSGSSVSVAHEIQSSFNPQSTTTFREEPQQDDSELPEFPSFSENQTSDVDNINIDDFQALLGQSILAGEGASGIGNLGSAGSAVAPSTDAAASNGSNQVGNSTTTWMSFPPSIVNLLQNEQMVETQAVPPGPVCFEDMDMLPSLDEERLMSIFNCGTQASFLSGHPT